ncbi:MAG TPA: chemotaxis protein CheX [Desulfobacteraceae bacterium]|nr:chemotaxis protein CheX [Desulfobacteraceae bacterium]
MTQMKTSISEVMETMFYYPVEIRGGTFDHVFRSQGTTTAAIRFSGPFCGSIHLAIPEALLSAMAENLMGVEQESLGVEQIQGTATEALNMITGNSFSRMDAPSPFDLGIPVVTDTAPGNPCRDNTLIIKTPDGTMAITAEPE